MNIVFYAKKAEFVSSKEMIDEVLTKRFQIRDYTLYKNENGKPFLTLQKESAPLFLSVTHTENFYFIAFSFENVGIDAEKCNRKVEYPSILRNFPLVEREKIETSIDFLKVWTAKESVIKWLGGTIAKDLKKLLYSNGKILFNGLELPVSITQKEILGHIVSVCHETVNEWKFLPVSKNSL